MKKRRGMVSNSSSASYIIIVEANEKDFFTALVEHVTWPYRDSIEEKLTGFIDNLKAALKEKKPFMSKEYQVLQLDGYITSLHKLEDADSVERMKIILAFYNIVWQLNKEGNIELNEMTSMHNNFEEGVSKLMKEIILAFMFETDIKLSGDVEHHG